ncbi:MAG: efflux RND transporter periplasmic adaptor subunit [Terracidiphilus sp.]
MIKERKGLDRGWLWVGVAVILVIVFFSARSLTRERLPVRIATVERAPLTSTLSTNGHVEPVMRYEYPSPIATTVKAVYVQPGDRVAKGKLLMVLDDAEARARLATAESGVKTAEAALEAATQNGTLEQRQASAAELARDRIDRDQAQRNLDALTKLSASGAASPSEVAAARQQLDTVEANIHAAELSAQGRYSAAEMARAQAALADAKANADAAREVLEKTSYRAPIAGTVYTVDARPTEYAEAGKVLLQMADLEHERVRAYFDEPDIGRLSVGQEIQIKWDAKPGEVWHGHIVRTPITVITYTTRTVGEVMIDIDGGDGDLLPDTNVTVTVTTASEADVLTIPRESLYSENGKPYVFKVVNDGLVRTPVTTGAINLTQVAILAGLSAGDIVATGTTTGQPLQVGVPIKRVQ